MDMHRQLLIRKEDQISRHNRGDDTAFDHSQNLSGSQNKAPPHNSRHRWAPDVHGSSKMLEETGLVLGGEGGSELNQEEVENLTNENYDCYQHNLNGSNSSCNNSSSHHHHVDSAVAGTSRFDSCNVKLIYYMHHFLPQLLTYKICLFRLLYLLFCLCAA